MNKLKKNNILECNLEIIKKCDKILYNELIKLDLKSYSTENVEIATAFDGTKIIKTVMNEHEWHFNSRYNPTDIAKQWANKMGKIETTTVITMFGFGNGLYLKEMMDRVYESVLFIIYEPSIEMFLKVIKEFDFSFLEERVYIVIEGVNENYFEAYFSNFIAYSNLSVCKFLGHPNYFECFKEKGKRYFARLKVCLNMLDAAKNTDIAQAEGYYKNTLINMKYLATASILDQIASEVGKTIPEGFPAIVVSAGPSLSKNIKELKKAKNKAFIIATDSALIGLLAEDIIPDVCVTADPFKELNRFLDPRIDYFPLACTECAQRDVLSKHKGKKIFMNDSYGYGDLLYKKMGVKYNICFGGGSVATHSYTMARIMGFKTIILVGQDLAFLNEQRYYDRIKEFGEEERLAPGIFTEVEDIHGNKVKTTKDLKLYLDWFEAQIARNKEIDTINATEGGAKMRGSRMLTLEAAIKECCHVEFNMEDYMKNIPPRLDNNERKEMLRLIHELPKQYEELLKDVTKGADLYLELITELEKSKPDYSDLLKLSKEIGKIMNEVKANVAYQHTQCKVKMIEYIALSNLGISCDDSKDDALNVAKRGSVMMESIKQALGEVIPEVKKITEEIALN